MAEPKKISTILVDDDEMVRQGIQLLLEKKEINVVAHAANGRDALSIVNKYHPQIAVLDITLPLLNGIEVAYQIRRKHTDTNVIMLTADRNHERVLESLQAGAIGYVWKGSDFSELELAIKVASIGRSFISPAVCNEVIANYLVHKAPEIHRDPLTSRQRQILQLIAEGYSNKESANALNLSVKAVEKHRAELMKRLGLHNTAKLVLYAVRTGVIKTG